MPPGSNDARRRQSRAPGLADCRTPREAASGSGCCPVATRCPDAHVPHVVRRPVGQDGRGCRAGRKIQDTPTLATMPLMHGAVGTQMSGRCSRHRLGVSGALAANTLWALDSSRVWLVLRDDVTVEAHRSGFFTSDRVAVKATMRAGFGFVHPQAVVRVTTARAPPRL